METLTISNHGVWYSGKAKDLVRLLKQLSAEHYLVKDLIKARLH